MREGCRPLRPAVGARADQDWLLLERRKDAAHGVILDLLRARQRHKGFALGEWLGGRRLLEGVLRHRLFIDRHKRLAGLPRDQFCQACGIRAEQLGIPLKNGRAFFKTGPTPITERCARADHGRDAGLDVRRRAFPDQIAASRVK